MIQSHTAQAWLRGAFTFLAILGGLVIVRQGGPVQFHAVNGDWRQSARSVLLGLAIGVTRDGAYYIIAIFPEPVLPETSETAATFAQAARPILI